LKQSQIRDDDIVEVDLWIDPRVVEMRHLQANGHVGNQRRVYQLTFFVDAAGKPTAEQIDSHDAEDEPEDEADDQYVKDGGNRLN